MNDTEGYKRYIATGTPIISTTQKQTMEQELYPTHFTAEQKSVQIINHISIESNL